MLNFVHTFGATKNEFSDKGGSLAPSVPYAGTTEGTCAEEPHISFLLQPQWQKCFNLPNSSSRPLRPQPRQQREASFDNARILDVSFACQRADGEKHGLKLGCVCHIVDVTPN
jgi:hypothetical protein